MKINEAIDKAKADSPKRKFAQSMDLFVNFKNIDFSKPDNRFSLELTLPKGRGKSKKVCAICTDELATNAKDVVDRIIREHELEAYGKDKKKLKQLAEEYDAFISDMKLMPLVGKFLGQVLGPRGKMPKPVPSNANIKPMAEKLKNTVHVKIKGKNLPVVHAPIGTEAMSTEDLSSNAAFVLNAIREKTPGREGNIKSIYVKTTMGPVVKIDEAF